MSNCENHKKEVAGITDMKVLAEMIGDLNYNSLSMLFTHLSDKLMSDGEKDESAGRIKLSEQLMLASLEVASAYFHLNQACQISEPFMTKPKTND